MPLPTRFSLELQKPRERPFQEWGNSLKSEKTTQAFLAWEGNKNLHCCPSSGSFKSMPAFFPLDPEALSRPSFIVSIYQMTSAMCKGIRRAKGSSQPLPLGALESVPPSPIPAAFGEGKEKLALTLQNNPARVGWGGGDPTMKRVCEKPVCVQWPLRNLSLGKTEDLYWHGLRKKCLCSFRTCPHRLQAKNVRHSILLSF